jgi:hypothetical protein
MPQAFLLDLKSIFLRARERERGERERERARGERERRERDRDRPCRAAAEQSIIIPQLQRWRASINQC